MKRKKKPKKVEPSRCCSPLCQREADERIDLIGPNGDFHGYLCFEHAKMVTTSFPAYYSVVALLRPVIT